MNFQTYKMISWKINKIHDPKIYFDIHNVNLLLRVTFI